MRDREREREIAREREKTDGEQMWKITTSFTSVWGAQLYTSNDRVEYSIAVNQTKIPVIHYGAFWASQPAMTWYVVWEGH